MDTTKKTYEEPFIKVLEFEFQSIVCQESGGNTEPIEPGEPDLPWD